MNNSYSGKGKLILAYAITGIVFGLLASNIMNMLAGFFSISFSSDLSNVFGMLFNIAEPLGIVFAIVNLLVIGALVWIFGMIGQFLKKKITGSSEKMTKRPHLFSFVLLGIITIGVITLFNSATSGVSPDASLTDINTLMGASGIVPMIGSIIAFSALGFIVVLLGSKGVALAENHTPDQLKKV